MDRGSMAIHRCEPWEDYICVQYSKEQGGIIASEEPER